MTDSPEINPREYDPDAFREWQRGPLAKRIAEIATTATDSPEIKRLRSHTLSGMVPADVAIQAVRDTEARVREERAVDFRPVSIESARRRMAREVVAALRDEWHARSDSTSIVGFQVAARFIERTFLPHPDNPECDDEAVGEAIDDLGAASLRAAFDEVCDELDNPEGT